jgi:DNA-binding NarL/FixJ family response regulator
MFAVGLRRRVMAMESVLTFRPSLDPAPCFVEHHHQTLVLTDAHGATSVWRRAADAPSPSAGSALSRAERAVVALVADGMTNRDIGARLHVSHRTVDSHVSHSLLKLGLTSRVQLAGYALRAGL